MEAVIERKLKIYIADDHPIVVDGLKEVLKIKSNWIVPEVAHDGQQLIELVKKSPPDIVVADINMPHMNGIQCAEWIKKNAPEVKVIILTMYPEKIYIDKLLRVGADGCLMKSRGSLDLIDAIQRVSEGKLYYDWATDFKKETDSKNFRLSEREVEIIRMIVEGKSNAEIADTIFISEFTVKTHRKNIFKKLNVHNVSELMSFVLNNGII